jgi:hypothetical protein
MPSAWNMFVKKIYEEGKAEDPNYEFKQALVDASKRKSEMGNSPTASGVKKSLKHNKTMKKSKRKRSLSLAGGKKSRKHRRHRRH